MLQILEEHTPELSRGASNRLANIGHRIGADVPFFLTGANAAYATGIGDHLTPIDLELNRAVLIIFDPAISVSTKDAYAGLGRAIQSGSPAAFSATLASSAADRVMSALASGDLKNDFEESVFRRHPRLLEIKTTLRERGATFALMSGSGSAVFGLFEEMALAAEAKRAFEREGVLAFLS